MTHAQSITPAFATLIYATFIFVFLCCGIQPSESDNRNSTTGSGESKVQPTPAPCLTSSEDHLFLSVETPPTWQGTIDTLVTTRCVVCHNPNAGLKKQPYLTSYAAVKTNGIAVVSDVKSGLMPTTGALPATETTAFLNWQLAGYPELQSTGGGGTNPAPSPSTTPGGTPSGTSSPGATPMSNSSTTTGTSNSAPATCALD